MCLVLTPLALDIVTRLRRNPIPYLLAIAMASNIGSAATITGNPQNMMIGTFSRIPYRTFAAAIAPISVIGLMITVALVAVTYRREFFAVPRIEVERPRVRVHRALLWKSVAAAVAMIFLFFAGLPVSKVAVVTGAILLVTRRVKPERIYREIDWSLLVLFAGLFVVIAGVEKTLLNAHALDLVNRLQLDRTGVLTAWSAILSNVVSNVPAVLVFKPFLSRLPDPQHAWLTLAMSSTLAGNLTVLGSIANLIVIERARRSVRISFLEYLKVGVPLTLLTLWIGVLILS
jgi:Na+/H+ antiporter NhaD/arsenite permease-like protein